MIITTTVTIPDHPALEADLAQALQERGILAEFREDFADAVGRMVMPLAQVSPRAVRVEVRVEETT